MEQIQFNCAVNTGTVSQSVISQCGEKSDLFPEMLKAQKSLGTTVPMSDQKDGSQGEECKTSGETKAKADKSDGTVSQQPLSLTDWFVPIIQGKSTGPPGMEIVDLNTAGKVEGTVQDLSVEAEGVTVNQVDAGFPGSGRSFPEMGGTKENGDQVANNRPVQVGQIPAPLVTASTLVEQSASVLQTGDLTQKNSLSMDPSQSVAAVLSEVANGSKGVRQPRVVNQPVSVSVEENALKPSSQPESETVSEIGQAGISEKKAAVVQTSTVAQTAEAFDRTDMPGSPKNTLQAEIAQPSKSGSQTQMVTQHQNAEQTKIQNTVRPEVLTHSQNTEQVKIIDQNLSTDDTGLQNTVRAEVLGQTQTFEQVKSTVQTQNAVRNQMVYQINSHFDKGQQEFEMQLYPQDLGKVNVKMKVENSNLIVEISAASTKAQSIILANADDIKAILQSQMNRDVQIAIPQDQKLMQQSYNDEQSGHQNPYSSDDQQSEEKEEQQEMDTDNFLNTLNMFGKKYFTERSREYGS